MKLLVRKCKTCGNEFKFYQYRIKNAKFCSRICCGIDNRGISRSPATEIKKGQILSHKVIFKKNDPRITGKANRLWKGDKAGYIAIHHWILRHWGNANKCENELCFYPRKINNGRILAQKAKRFEWAFLKKKYTRKRKDYVQLCASCHRKFDQKNVSIIIKGKIYENSTSKNN